MLILIFQEQNLYYNPIWFFTKVLNIIHKKWSNLYQNDKEIKSSYQVLRVSCTRVLQSWPVHNELTLLFMDNIEDFSNK